MRRTARRTRRTALCALAAGLLALGTTACEGETEGADTIDVPSAAPSSPGAEESSPGAEPSASPGTGTPSAGADRAGGDEGGASGGLEHVCGASEGPELSQLQRDTLAALDKYKDALDDEDSEQGASKGTEIRNHAVAPGYILTLKDWEKQHSADGLFRKQPGATPQCWDVLAPPSAGGAETLVVNYHWFEDNDSRVMFALDKMGDGGTVITEVTDSPV